VRALNRALPPLGWLWHIHAAGGGASTSSTTVPTCNRVIQSNAVSNQGLEAGAWPFLVEGEEPSAAARAIPRGTCVCGLAAAAVSILLARAYDSL
jgi:hypothetical protein